MTSRPVIIGHRGNSSVAPQNTMASFDAARRAGADFFELDIQVTADGDAAVIHNDTFDATTDATGPVAARSAAELSGIDAGSSFSPIYAGQHVPLLSEVLEFLRAHAEIGLVLEIKDAWTEEALARVVDAVSAPFLQGRLIVESFSVETMRIVSRLAPELRRDLLVGEADDGLLALAAELGLSGIGPYGPLLQQHPDLIDEVHAAGLTVHPWTLNEPDHWSAAVEHGVDGIVTDRPDRLLGWFAGRGM